MAMPKEVRELLALMRKRGWEPRVALELALRFIVQNAEAGDFAGWLEGIDAAPIRRDAAPPGPIADWYELPIPEDVRPIRSWSDRARIDVQRKRRAEVVEGKYLGYHILPTTVIRRAPDNWLYRGPDINLPEAQAFLAWVEKIGMPRLRKVAIELNLNHSDDREVVIDDAPYHLRANPKRSYGYLYIRAWEA